MWREWCRFVEECLNDITSGHSCWEMEMLYTRRGFPWRRHPSVDWFTFLPIAYRKNHEYKSLTFALEKFRSRESCRLFQCETHVFYPIQRELGPKIVTMSTGKRTTATTHYSIWPPYTKHSIMDNYRNLYVFCVLKFLFVHVIINKLQNGPTTHIYVALTKYFVWSWIITECRCITWLAVRK